MPGCFCASVHVCVCVWDLCAFMCICVCKAHTIISLLHLIDIATVVAAAAFVKVFFFCNSFENTWSIWLGKSHGFSYAEIDANMLSCLERIAFCMFSSYSCCIHMWLFILFLFGTLFERQNQFRTIHQRHHQLMASCKRYNTSAEHHIPWTVSILHRYRGIIFIYILCVSSAARYCILLFVCLHAIFLR